MSSSKLPARQARPPRTIDAPTSIANSDWLPDYRAVLLIACVISLVAFMHFARVGQLLLYGDAVAHMNIARRVVD